MHFIDMPSLLKKTMLLLCHDSADSHQNNTNFMYHDLLQLEGHTSISMQLHRK
jgi:hypothetical protein